MNTTPSVLREKPSAFRRIMASWIDVSVAERPGLFSAFLCALCMFAAYSILRPVRETMGINSGVSSLPLLFWGTFACMLVMQPLYGWLISHYSRSRALPRIYLFFSLSLLAFFAWFQLQTDHVWIARAYFIWVSVFNLFVVAVFWSLMAEVFNTEQASRFFGVISAGLSIGGLLGPLLAASLAHYLGTINLLLISAGLLMVSAFFMYRVTLWARDNGSVRNEIASSESALKGRAWDGFAQVVRSPYLLGLAVFVLLLTSVSTIVYLEQQRVVAATVTDPDARTALFAHVDFWVQAISLLAQLFLFSRLLRRFGFAAMLLSIPLLMVLAFAAIGFTESFQVVLCVMVLRRVGEYAVTRPCRDILMTVVSREEKYKAKNLIDTFIYRGGDALSASAYTGLVAVSSMASGTVAGTIGVVVSLAWLGVAWWLAQRFQMVQRQEPNYA